MMRDAESTWEDDMDVLHIPMREDQRVPRHRLAPLVVAANCRTCGRYVMRWSLMGPASKATMVEVIRMSQLAEMVRLIRWGMYSPRFAVPTARALANTADGRLPILPPEVDVRDGHAVLGWIRSIMGELTTPATDNEGVSQFIERYMRTHTVRTKTMPDITS